MSQYALRHTPNLLHSNPHHPQICNPNLSQPLQTLTPPPQAKESKRLIKCFLNFVRHERAEVNVLFDMLSIFLTPTRIDYTFLKAFFMIEVPEQYTPGEKRAVLLRFLELFRQKALGQELLVVAMQLLILPMLTHAFTHGEATEVIEEGTIGIVVEHLLDPPAEVRFVFRGRSGHLGRDKTNRGVGICP
jgi:hypothetical protein